MFTYGTSSVTVPDLMEMNELTYLTGPTAPCRLVDDVGKHLGFDPEPLSEQHRFATASQPVFYTCMCRCDTVVDDSGYDADSPQTSHCDSKQHAFGLSVNAGRQHKYLYSLVGNLRSESGTQITAVSDLASHWLQNV